MDPFVRRFVRASLCWLGFGVVLGTAMTFSPALLVYRPAHMHANLLGFVSMMIFGVGYHVLPRFAGRSLRSPRMAALHFVLANIGLAAMVAGWLGRVHAPGWVYSLRVGALLSTAGVFLFIYNIWRTIDSRDAGLTSIAQRR